SFFTLHSQFTISRLLSVSSSSFPISFFTLPSQLIISFYTSCPVDILLSTLRSPFRIFFFTPLFDLWICASSSRFNGLQFKARTKDIVEATVRRFNDTVFAYGQTNSGKTYTMRGSKAEPGVIPLAINDLFRIIQQNYHLQTG
ncbi:hypothetical protein VIGAN_03139300, partial [Vigna angularis var. angularis]